MSLWYQIKGDLKIFLLVSTGIILFGLSLIPPKFWFPFEEYFLDQYMNYPIWVNIGQLAPVFIVAGSITALIILAKRFW